MSVPASFPVVAITATTELLRGLTRVRVNRAYTDAVARVGLLPMVVPPLDPDLAQAVVESIAGLLLTGGEDVAPRHYGAQPHPTVEVHEERDAFELALVSAARARGTPTLAICRGVQLMNVAHGGTLVQDIPSQRAGALDHAPGGAREVRVHEVRVEPGSRLAAVLGSDRVMTNSSHHQAIDRLGSSLRAVARAPDGIVEAIEPTNDGWWMLGVQWHPEELTATPEAWDRRLFEAFASTVSEWKTANGKRKS